MITYLTALQAKFKLPLTTPDFLDKKHFQSLDGWRGLSIILVVLGHLKRNVEPVSYYYKIADMIIYGHLGVRIFFVLSGFLITSLLIKEYLKTDGINIKRFFINRILRIFPALYLFLFILAILNYLFGLEISLKSFLGAAFFINNFPFFTGCWYTGHIWSLAVKEQFYLIWPFIFFYVKDNTWQFAIFALITIVALKAVWRFYPDYYSLTLGPFFRNAEAIFTGAVMAFISFRGFVNSNHKIWKSATLNLLSILIILMVSYFQKKGDFGLVLYPFGSIIQNLAIGFLIFQTLINSNSVLYKLLNTKFMIKIGMISYSIYLWQQLFIVPFNLKDKIPYLLQFPTNIIITVVIAYLSYKYFESYFLKLKIYLY